MLTEFERKECENILKKLQTDDLLALKDTVTNRQVAAEGRDDAIQVILSYSETSKDLLRRKKILRNYLFQYLHEKGIIANPNAEKHQLVDKVVDYWTSTCKSDNGEAQKQNIEERLKGKEELNQPRELTVPSQQVYNTSTVSSNQVQVLDTVSSGGDYVACAVQSQAKQEICLQSNENILDDRKSNTDQLLAETFVTWFYKMMNSLNPSMNQSPEDFGPHHFWNDVRLRILTVLPEPSVEEFLGCEMVSQRLLALVRDELLLFNPNVSSDGVRTKKNQHGLLAISVCGTIHRGNDCLGIFEQDFGLIRDARIENNWKIKFTAVKFKCTAVMSMPVLESEKNLLAITSLEDQSLPNDFLQLT